MGPVHGLTRRSVEALHTWNESAHGRAYRRPGERGGFHSPENLLRLLAMLPRTAALWTPEHAGTRCTVYCADEASL